MQEDVSELFSGGHSHHKNGDARKRSLKVLDLSFLLLAKFDEKKNWTLWFARDCKWTEEGGREGGMEGGLKWVGGGLSTIFRKIVKSFSYLMWVCNCCFKAIHTKATGDEKDLPCTSKSVWLINNCYGEKELKRRWQGVDPTQANYF